MGLHSIFVANCWYLDTPIMIAVWEALHIENKHPDVLLLWCTCNASFFCWCDGFFCYWTAFFNTQCAFNRLYTLQISQFLVLFMNAKVANCVLVQFIYLIYCCASCCNHSKSAVIWILFSITWKLCMKAWVQSTSLTVFIVTCLLLASISFRQVVAASFTNNTPFVFQDYCFYGNIWW